MAMKVYASIAVALGLLAIACGGSSTGSTTVIPATSAPAAAQTTTGGAAAPTSAPAAEPTEAPSIAKVGDRVELNGTALTVAAVSRADSLGQFNKAKDGNEFVVADVVIENIDKDKAPYNPLYFKAKDSEGFEVNAELIAGDKSLKSGELAKGEKVRGNVAFEVKKGTEGLVLEYKPLILGSSDAIKVALD